MTSTSDDDLTRDAFLGGRLQLSQPRRGYRAGVDPVLLAAAVPARAGQSVLELGCGVGAASLCLGARVPGLCLTGVEIQPRYAALARRNAAEAGADMTVFEADLAALPADLRRENFDHVIMNPPYFEAALGTGSADAGRDTALRGPTPLATWIEVALRRTRPKGYLTMIQRIERLPESLSALDSRIGGVRVAPLAARPDRAPHLFILSGKKGARAPFTMTAPIVMHVGAAHMRDGEDYTEIIADVLRKGTALPIWQ